jgi:hypothetical protein
MWNLLDEANSKTKEENALKLKLMLENLKPQIEVIKNIEVGINIANEDGAFDVILISDFKSLEDLEIYKVHPKHLEVAEFCKNIRKERVVVDYEI